MKQNLGNKILLDSKYDFMYPIICLSRLLFFFNSASKPLLVQVLKADGSLKSYRVLFFFVSRNKLVCIVYIIEFGMYRHNIVSNKV